MSGRLLLQVPRYSIVCEGVKDGKAGDLEIHGSSFFFVNFRYIAKGFTLG